jgi:hypothetical protein
MVRTMSVESAEVSSRPADEDEKYFLKLAREEFGASLGRIEEAAKYVVAAIGAVAGLVLAGLQVKVAINPKLNAAAFTWPVLLWGVSGVLAILVFFPLPYRHFLKAPSEIRRVFETARWQKWGLLLASVSCFAAGLLVMVSTL